MFLIETTSRLYSRVKPMDSRQGGKRSFGPTFKVRRLWFPPGSTSLWETTAIIASTADIGVSYRNKISLVARCSYIGRLKTHQMTTLRPVPANGSNTRQ